MHELEGWVVFLGCIFALVAIQFSLGLFWKTSPPKITEKPSATPKPTKPHVYILAVLVLIFSAGSAAQTFTKGMRVDNSPRREAFNNFPLTIGAWIGRAEALPENQIKGLQLSDYFLADYHNHRVNDLSINFYMAYYATQRQNAAPHSPLVCLNGSGWEIIKLDQNFYVRDPNGKPILKVNRAIIENGKDTDLIYFWYQERGRNLTTTTERKWYLLKDSLQRGRSDGALVRVVTHLDKSSSEEADNLLSSFLLEAMPLTIDFIPQ
jgi:EpsI family protein